MQSAISPIASGTPKKRKPRVGTYIRVPEGHQSASAKIASTRNFRIRTLKSALAIFISIKEEPPVKSISAENIQDTIDCLVDLINELILEGNPTIKRKLTIEGKTAWADSRRLWYFGPYGCLQSTRYTNVAEAHEVEEEMNKRRKTREI